MKIITFSTRSVIFWLNLITLELSAINSLTVADPRGFVNGKGSIDSATLAIRPKGAFLEHSLYLNFSAKSLNFKKTDTLEVVFNFELPENAIVTDSWLWLTDDIILKGKLLDVWTATGIYEEIVRRRRDPSLLRRTGPTQYELRIFPMAGTDYRKVKISYLLPSNISGNQMSQGIYMPYLQTSKVPLPEIQLVYFLTEKHLTPTISLGLNPPAAMWSGTDPTLGSYFYKTVPTKDAINGFGLTIQMEKNFNSFYSTFSIGKDHYYQIGIKLDSALDSAQTKKVLVILDYYSSFSNSLQEVLSSLETALSQNLAEQHLVSFLFMENLSVQQIYPEWKSATATNIQNAIVELKNRMGNAGSTVQLLNSGLEFLNKSIDPANVFMITGGNSYADWQTSNTVIQLLKARGLEKYPVTIADISNRFSSCYWLNNTYYCNNQYLNSNLANLTGGSYSRIEGGKTVQTFLIQMAGKTRGNILNLDFYTRPDQGFCFNRYLSKSIVEYSLGDYVIQVGKYNGTLPFRAELSGILDARLFNIRLDIPLENELPSDPAISQCWAGYHIRELEKSSTNIAVSNIIATSQEYNVLSKYTAFLCLEDTSYFCLNCIDDTKVISDVDNLKDSLQLIAQPNPFSDHIQFILENMTKIPRNEIVVQIVDLNGVVRQKLVPYSDEGSRMVFHWEPNASFHSGIYTCVLRTRDSMKTIKIVRL